ncbi:MAG: hypothetical protein GWN14_18830, partial [candidate division Zixibacteria bacterium]|nr:hypothetical protein [candidate division Zixibacteria bacterium]NIX57919.1 hypothetical protein [candidate division Zixibacteria bacterium]
LGLTYGQRFSDHFQGGITIKFLRSFAGKIGGEDISANSWAVDLGVNWINLFPSSTFQLPSRNELIGKDWRKQIDNRGINIGVALLNAGPDIAYINESQADPIPQRLGIGVAYQLLASPVIGLGGLFDFEKELVHRDEGDTDPFYQAWVTGWQGKTFKEAIYHFGAELQLVSVISFRYGYRYAPFQGVFDNETGISTIGLGLDLKYISLHYGQWIDKDQLSVLRKNTYVIGLSMGNIEF